jgi:hypothetical protein
VELIVQIKTENPDDPWHQREINALGRSNRSQINLSNTLQRFTREQKRIRPSGISNADATSRDFTKGLVREVEEKMRYIVITCGFKLGLLFMQLKIGLELMLPMLPMLNVDTMKLSLSMGRKQPTRLTGILYAPSKILRALEAHREPLARGNEAANQTVTSQAMRISGQRRFLV